MGDDLRAEFEIHSDKNGPFLTDGVCGHCKRHVHFIRSEHPSNLQLQANIPPEANNAVGVNMWHELIVGICPRPTCRRPTIVYRCQSWEVVDGGYGGDDEPRTTLEVIFPRMGGLRPPLDDAIPSAVRDVFFEAASIEFLSPNAAAFLAGRILEWVLRRELKSTKMLAELVKQFIEVRHPPHELATMMTLVRGFRNIAGHPGEDQEGILVNVDQAEASFLLGVVGEMLDFIYIRPARAKAMTESLEAKTAGKKLPPPAAPPKALPKSAPSEPSKKGGDYDDFPTLDDDDDLPF